MRPPLVPAARLWSMLVARFFFAGETRSCCPYSILFPFLSVSIINETREADLPLWSPKAQGQGGLPGTPQLGSVGVGLGVLVVTTVGVTTTADGSKISAPVPNEPPAIRTWPSCSKVAMWPTLACGIGSMELHCVEGSKSSAEVRIL